MYLLQFIPFVLSNKEKEEIAVKVIFFAITLVLPLAIGIVSYANYRTYKWKKGKFPKNLKFNEDNLLEAYISLSALMLRNNPLERHEKIKYMNTYFSKEFPKSNYNFQHSLNFAYDYPIQLDTICFWINKHLLDKSHRVQIIYFLAGISIIDGRFEPREMNLLIELTQQLKLKQKDLESIIAMFEQTRDRQKEYEQKKAENQFHTTRKTNLDLNYKILGLESNATFEEVKKAYRKLAKMHHPDKFMHENPDRYRMAEEHFIKIQQAYEAIENKYK
jgi:DnaJ like chaperone protein